jgi:hypothetical protein
LTIYYLLEAAVSEKEQGIKMTFFNPSENKWKEVMDTEYRPYFYIPYPTSEEDLKVTQEQKLKINLVEKTDLCHPTNRQLFLPGDRCSKRHQVHHDTQNSLGARATPPKVGDATRKPNIILVL